MKSMEERAIRLRKGDDLKESIQAICKDVSLAVVLSSVGCLSKAHMRMAGANSELTLFEDLEIISLNGTISSGKAHLHISVSNDKGEVSGGHLKEGCIVNTTCELVLGILEQYDSYRAFDEETGYDEICFIKR